jgi:hypothetical protein
MDQFKIGVAIPTYARRDLLLRLIDSIPRDWHVFVSDNNASLLPMTQPLDARVHVSHATHLLPMFANWNRALSLVDTSCTHVFVPSDDDLFLPAAGAAVDAALSQHPDADIVVFGCDFFDEEDRTWMGYCPQALVAYPPGDGFPCFVRGVDARMPGILFRREFLLRLGAFDERFELTAADSDVIQRALLLGASVFVPTVIGQYRVWTGSLTHARQATDLWMREVALWTDKIADLLRTGHQPKRRHIDAARFQDEILALNLLAGLRNLIAKQQLAEASDFLRRHPIPRKALLRTRLRLLRCWLQLRSQGA